MGIMSFQNLQTGIFDPINLAANLKISSDVGAIDIEADGNRIFVRPSSLRVAFRALSSFDGLNGFVETLNLVDQTLKRADITLFWRFNQFAILGINAKPHFLKILTALYKLNKTFRIGAKRRVHHH